MRIPNPWTITTAILLLASASVARPAERCAAGGHADRGAEALGCAATPADSGSFASTRTGTGTATEAGTKWIVDRADNICGLDDPKMLSKPAKVDYDALLKVTSEMKKMRDDKIDPSSPEGIRLRQAAVDRVRSAADKVRVAEGYCSVWKEIRHQDGRTIPDITDLVKAQL